MNMEFHALANLFPLIEGAEFGALIDDIRANGLRDEIWLLNGQILDGRNRYRACTTAGITVQKWQFKDFDPAQHGEPLAFVLSKNLARRHLDESQRAMVATRIANMKQGERRATEEPKPANLPVSPKVDQAAAAKTLNVSERSVRSAKKVMDKGVPELVSAVDRGKMSVSVAAKAAELAPEKQQEAVKLAEAGNANAARTMIKRDARDAKEESLGDKQRALPDRKFGVIYADPEWRFEPYSRETGMDRAPENHYPTSTLDEIMARPVATIAADDSVLFLWATPPMIKEALAVIEAWGFTYKAQCIWAKKRPGAGHGTGYWFWGEHELLLVGTRGKIPAPAPGTQWESVIEAPVGEHSEKPTIFHELIEAYFPSLPKIELNARAGRAGWELWGNEAPAAENQDIFPDDFNQDAGYEIESQAKADDEATPTEPSEVAEGQPEAQAEGPDGAESAGRLDARRSASATSEIMDVTGGESATPFDLDKDMPEYLRRALAK